MRSYVAYCGTSGIRLFGMSVSLFVANVSTFLRPDPDVDRLARPLSNLEV